MTWFTLEHAWSVRLLLALGHFVWQGLAIAVVAGLVSLLLRRGRPEYRYALQLAALAGMALCVPVTFVVLDGEGAQPQAGLMPQAVVVGEEIDTTPPAEVVPAPADESVASEAVEVDAVEVVASAAAVEKRVAVPAPGPRRGVLRWRPVALRYAWLGWHVGVMLLFARLTVGLLFSTRLGRHSTPVEETAILSALGRQAKALGLAVAPPVAWCGRVGTPTVVGVLRPMVLLPLSLSSGLSPAQVEMLLCHELAHIRRYDPVVNLLQRVVEAVLFYHPGVWYVSRQIRAERELCCDDRVVRIHGGARDYAASLVALAARATGQTVAVTGMAAGDRPSQLRRRVLRLLEGPVQSQVHLLRGRGLGLALLVSVLTLGAAVYSQAPGEAADWQPVYRLEEALPEPAMAAFREVLTAAEIPFREDAAAGRILVAEDDLARAREALREDENTRLLVLGAEAIETAAPEDADAGRRLERVGDEIQAALDLLEHVTQVEEMMIPGEEAYPVPHLVVLVESADGSQAAEAAIRQAVESFAGNYALRVEWKSQAHPAAGGEHLGFILYPEHPDLSFHWLQLQGEQVPLFDREGRMPARTSGAFWREPVADLADVVSFAVEPEPVPGEPPRVVFSFSDEAAQHITGESERLGHRELAIVSGRVCHAILTWARGMRGGAIAGLDGEFGIWLQQAWEASRTKARARALVRERLGMPAGAPWHAMPDKPHFSPRLQFRPVGMPEKSEFLLLRGTGAGAPPHWLEVGRDLLAEIRHLEAMTRESEQRDGESRDVRMVFGQDMARRMLETARDHFFEQVAVVVDGEVVATFAVSAPAAAFTVVARLSAETAEAVLAEWQAEQPRSPRRPTVPAAPAEAAADPERNGTQEMELLAAELRGVLDAMNFEGKLDPVVIAPEQAEQAAHLVCFVEPEEGGARLELANAVTQRMEGAARNHGLGLEVRAHIPDGGQQGEAVAWLLGFVFRPQEEDYEITFRWMQHEGELVETDSMGFRSKAGYRHVWREPVADMTDVDAFERTPEYGAEGSFQVAVLFTEAAAARVTRVSEHLGHRKLALVQGGYRRVEWLWTPGVQRYLIRDLSEDYAERLALGWACSRPLAKARALLRERMGPPPSETALPRRPIYSPRVAFRLVAEAGDDHNWDYLPGYRDDPEAPYRWLAMEWTTIYDESSFLAVEVAPNGADPSMRDITIKLGAEHHRLVERTKGLAGRKWCLVVDGRALAPITFREPLTPRVEITGVPAAAAEDVLAAWRWLHPGNLEASPTPEPVASARGAGLELRWVGAEGNGVDGEWLDFYEEAAADGQGPLYVLKAVLADLGDFVAMDHTKGPVRTGGPALRVRPTPEAARRIQAATAEHEGERLAVVFGGRIVGAPVVRSAFGGAMQLRVPTDDLAERIVAAWTAGAGDVFADLATPEYRAFMTEGDLVGAVRAYVDWLASIPVEQGRDRQLLTPLYEHFDYRYGPRPYNAESLLMEVVDGLLAEWEAAGEQDKIALLEWRWYALRGELRQFRLSGSGGPSNWGRAVKSYPDVAYPDPATQSSLPGLYTEWMEESGDLEFREQRLLGSFKSDPRFLYIEVEPWKGYFRGRFQPRRYEGFLERVMAAYAEKAQAQPESAALLERYREAAAGEYAAVHGSAGEEE